MSDFFIVLLYTPLFNISNIDFLQATTESQFQIILPDKGM